MTKSLSNYLCFILSIPLCIISCKSYPKASHPFQIVGSWQDASDMRKKIVFRNDGIYDEFDQNGKVEFKFYTQTKDSLTLKNFGSLKYTTTSSGDSIFVNFIGELNNELYSNELFINKRASLIRINHKTLPGIKDHIDEISVYKNIGKNRTGDIKYGHTDFTSIVLPAKFTGLVYIAYNQPDGINLETGKRGKVLAIPSSGVVKVKDIEVFDSYLDGNLKFYYNKNLAENPDINFISYIDFRKSLLNKDFFNAFLETHNIQYSTVVAIPLGFNASGRERVINKLFNDSIIGNVEMFEIDTLKNIVEHYKLK